MSGTSVAPSKGKRPKALSPRPYAFPRFERRRLGNGMQLVVAPVRKLPIATVMALIDAGAVCDDAGYEGIASLTCDLLLEGTLTHDGVQLTERFERLGASVVTAADWDGAAVTLTALREHLAPAIALLGEVLRAPAFPQREVERLKAERMAELLQLRAEPRGLADELFSRFLYEEDSRYSRPEGGSEESVESIHRADIQQFYESRYRPGAVTLVIAGDIDVEDAASLASSAFGDWTGVAPKAVQSTFAPARRERALHIVSKPDAQQSEIRLGCVFLPRSHPDYHAAVVMNAVLGGLFSSRINLNLREKHGYTYGAFSHLDWRRQAGPFVVSTAVQSEVTAPAAREAISEIEQFLRAPISEDELSLATSYLGGVFPIRYETTDAIAGALAALVRYDLPDDFYDTYRDQVRAITAADVLRVAKRHLDARALQMVVVGDLDGIREPLEALGFGGLTVYNTEGEVL
ncbi:MAG TPA: pitrilysin family protein [Gemmatimonadaceae bacterium]|nr:pitrilysin family protein [Gemmatimonadaceae bacterium]